MIRKATAMLALVIGFASPAWAQVAIGTGGNATGGNASASTGHATGIGNSAIVGSGNNSGSNIGNSSVKSDIKNTSTNVNTNLNTNANLQHQGQDQKQGQAQGQQQGQGQGQSYEGEQSVNFGGTKFDRYAPSIAAPALTSGGIGICLGSFSVGLTGPMAGVAFGKTTQDEGCARARDSMILHNMGHKGASLRVLAGESIKDAMIAEGILPAPKQAASLKAPAAAPSEPVTVSPADIFGEQTAAAIQPSAVQGN